MRIRLERGPRRLTVLAMACGMLASTGAMRAARDARTIPKADARTVAHVLNRIGFGPRPGDVARVQAMGLAAYIDQQLHPERIDDAALDARLAEFPTLAMSSEALAKQYFLPAIALRRRAQLDQQAAPVATTPPTSTPDRDGGTKNDEMMAPSQAGSSSSAAPTAAAVPASPELRQAQAAARDVLVDLMQAKMLRATLSNRQLDEVLVDFWFNHFNVFVGKGQVRMYLPEYERDVIRPHVLGRFRDLLGAVAHSPAMLFYLDNWQSSAPNAPAIPPALQQRLDDPRLPPARRQMLLARLNQVQNAAKRQPRGINENYAREIMELHTLGVDGGYTQQDVQELARIFTGWTIDRPQQGGAFVFRPAMHDTGTKTFLGVTFTNDGEREGERALDLLASRPATAHHIAYELAQRFVSDNPPKALVDRAARTFLDTDGDLRAVTRTIIMSPEFFAPDAYRAKVKTPLEFVVSAVRATGATVTSALPLVAAMSNLGMPLYGCEPPPGYTTTAGRWVNTGALLARMNFAVDLMNGGRITLDTPAGRGGAGAFARQAVRPDRPARGTDGAARVAARVPIHVDIASLAPDTSAATRDRLIDTMLAGDVSDATRATLARADTPQHLVALVLGSPEFQRR